MLSVAAMIRSDGVMDGPQRDRATIAEEYAWNLADIYPSEDAWRAEKERVTAELPALRAFEGTLGSSAQALARGPPPPRISMASSRTRPFRIRPSRGSTGAP